MPKLNNRQRLERALVAGKLLPEHAPPYRDGATPVSNEDFYDIVGRWLSDPGYRRVGIPTRLVEQAESWLRIVKLKVQEDARD